MSDAKTIKLNGRSYDARTGKAIDGMVSPAGPAKPAIHRPASQVIHHKVERSKTLMRDVVKKPANTEHHSKLAQPHASAGQKLAPSQLMAPSAIRSQRVARAQSVAQSSQIRRFNDVAGKPSVVTKSHKLDVKPVPDDVISHHQTPPITIEHRPAADIFTTAVQNATSHTEPAHKTKKHQRAAKKIGVSSRVFTVSSMLVMVLLLGGFFTWQNASNVSFRMAAAKAGLKATLPGYKPSGFAMKGPLQSAPGQITVSFRSNSDERSFNITQKSSNWNSEALRENFVASNQHDYQTVQDKGKTVYIYDGSNATWVDGGVWYMVEGDSSLTNDQLLRIADSM